MNRVRRPSEAGATLVVSLIMLALITLMLLAALAIGSANFKTVTNMQFRDEAIAAANRAIDEVISSAFALDPTAEQILVDLDNDGTPDYTVDIFEPECLSAEIAAVTSPSSESLPPAMGASSTWNTVWEIRATVAEDSDGNAGEAAVDVRTGVRVLLSEAQKNLVCI
jgi:type II secretory pathway pseudopilin PulG